MAPRKAQPDSETINLFAAEDAKAAKVAEIKKTRATEKFKDKLLPVTPKRRESIDRLFALWKKEYDYKRMKLNEARTVCLNARLYHGFTEAELMLVLMFVKDLPFWRGQNDRNQPYDDLTVLFGNNERTQRLLVQARAGRKEVDRRTPELAAGDDLTIVEVF